MQVSFRLIAVLRSKSYTDSSRPEAVVVKRQVTSSKLGFRHRFVICICNNSIPVELIRNAPNMKVNIDSIYRARLLALFGAPVFC
jgi:hypothetical protein